MPLIPLIATRPYRYAGKLRQKGERFEATRTHAKVLKALRIGTDAPAVPVVRATPPVKPVMPVVPVASEHPVSHSAVESVTEDDDTQKKKRTYRRRDMTAED